MPIPDTCPACGRANLIPALPPSQIELENQQRERFVTRRLHRQPDEMEAMDLTRFMHGGPAELFRCPACGTLLRDEESQASYESDQYDPVLMKHLYPRYLRAFQSKRPQYADLLRPGAEVVEAGSHLGAFLQSAEEWGWRPTGLDIGDSTTAFARRQGVTVKRRTLEDYSPRLRNPEAVFIWNCFEQLEDPAASLRHAHRLLDRHGLLVLRVPNAAFYTQGRRNPSPSTLQLLGYNNLLGFPYLHGYTPDALNRLLRASHFQPLAVHNASLLTPPYPDMSTKMRTEWREARNIAERISPASGPWIEVVSRKCQ